MKKPLSRAAFAVFALAAAGCMGPAPQIFLYSPNQNQVNVDATIPTVSASYTAELDPSSVKGDSIQVFEVGGSGQALPGTTTFDSVYLDLIFKLDAQTSLKPDTEYLVTISGDLKDASGATFGSSVSWSFKTGDAKGVGK